VRLLLSPVPASYPYSSNRGQREVLGTQPASTASRPEDSGIAVHAGLRNNPILGKGVSHPAGLYRIQNTKEGRALDVEPRNAPGPPEGTDTVVE